MIKLNGVLHFSIVVSELDRSRKFYTELLGLTFVAAPAGSGMVFLRAGSDHVILCQSEDGRPPATPGEGTRVHHAFHVDPGHYEEAKTLLQSSGMKILLEENRTAGVFVGRQFYFHDPDGNVLEISECAPPIA
jgi:catechol 2,3-dioxygenase-like lactoylglutathione lyase family enzyme